MDALSAAGFFKEPFYASQVAGPTGFELIIVQTKENSGRMAWASNAFGPYPPPEPLRATLEILQSFRKEIEIGKQIYEPSYVALWIWKPCDCNPRPTERTDGQWTDGRCSHCGDLNVFSQWPFRIAPPYEALAANDCSSYLEMPYTMSDVMSEIPSLKEYSLGQNYTRDYVPLTNFRDGDTIMDVQIRPYLPGEKAQVMCSENRWDYRWPIYDTLPLYASPEPVR